MHTGTAAMISNTECCFKNMVDMEIKNAEIPKNVFQPAVFRLLQSHPQSMTATEPTTNTRYFRCSNSGVFNLFSRNLR